MREHEGIKSKSEKFKEDEMSPLEHCSYVKYLVDREALVIIVVGWRDVVWQRQRLLSCLMCDWGIT